MTVLIAGAGIGGLAAALSLHQIGVDAIVYEAVPKIEALGVGINVLPHAARELFELGLEEPLLRESVQTAELAFLNRHGQRIWSEARGRAAGYRWPQLAIHRGRLQAILLDAARNRLGAGRIVAGEALESFSETDGGVIAKFRNGAEARGGLLIGADGIHSAVRRAFHPEEGPPKWNGAILWRGLSEMPEFKPGPAMFMCGHERQKFVCYPISLRDGRASVNWIAELKFAADHEWSREDWNRQGALSSFLPKFETWSFEGFSAPDIIRAAPRCFEFPMVDRDPLDRWTRGRATLLGDAAHPMYPIGSNGASQAILDARVLAREIKTRGETPEALESYEAERRPATSEIVAANRANMAEKFMQLVEDRAPDGFARVDDTMSPDEIAGMMAGYKRLAGFDKDTLNARAPIVT
jgi:5-methylphenazine-1-carboxylate 1-monooxygenase